MSRNVKFLLILAIIFSFSLGAVANASGGLTELKEVYQNNNISVVINGKVLHAKDPDDGSIYVPITYKGRTYLPLRAVAEAVGLPVDYDNNTKTAYLGTKPNSVGGPAQDVYINATQEYVDSTSVKLFVTKKIDANRLTTLTGRTFDYGYCCETGRFMKPNFKCDFKYKRLKFTLYTAWSQKELDTNKKAETPITVKITDELGTVIKEVKDLKHGTETEFDIDCIDYKTLQVYTYGGGTIIGEPKFLK